MDSRQDITVDETDHRSDEYQAVLECNRATLHEVQKQFCQQQRQGRATIEAGPHLQDNIVHLQKRLAELDGMTPDQQRELLAWQLEFFLAFLPPDFENLLFVQYLRKKLQQSNWNLQRLVHRRHAGGCDKYPELFKLLASFDHAWVRSQLRTHEFFADAVSQQQATREV
jgi:hypothetical protein